MARWLLLIGQMLFKGKRRDAKQCQTEDPVVSIGGLFPLEGFRNLVGYALDLRLCPWHYNQSRVLRSNRTASQQLGFVPVYGEFYWEMGCIQLTFRLLRSRNWGRQLEQMILCKRRHFVGRDPLCLHQERVEDLDPSRKKGHFYHMTLSNPRGLVDPQKAPDTFCFFGNK